MLSSRASAPACAIRRAYSIQESGEVPLSDAMTGTATAALILWSCSRYSVVPSEKREGSGRYDSASAYDSLGASCASYVASSSPTICSSKSDLRTIAAAPASSRRRTVSRSSASGDEPGMRGCGRWNPR